MRGSEIDRRSFMRMAPAAALAASGAGFRAAPAAEAAAPFAGIRGPAFHRMTLGHFEITALLDGTIPLPLCAMHTNTSPAHVDAALAAAFLRAPVGLSVNAYLVIPATGSF